VVIALVIFYWLYLTIVQLISGPQRDLKSLLPVPPRALTGNGAWPVLGHTIFFHKYGQNIAYLFSPEWREWFFIPWSKKLGDTYSVFVWGQWHVVVKGSEKVEKLILEGDLTEGWPYKSPPITLLGKTCLAILEEEEAACLRSMISQPLSHDSVVKHAPRFAELAEKCIENVISGRFSNKGEKQQIAKIESASSDSIYDELMNTSDSASSDDGEKTYQIKLNALRSYTLDLMHGPVLNLNRSDRQYNMSTTMSNRKMSHDSVVADVEKSVRFADSEEEKDETYHHELPSQEMLLLWMERLKKGLCAMKITYGSTWMQLWRMNWYGRALDARSKLEMMLSAHVEEREKRIPVHHEKGRVTRDPLASSIPLWRLTELYFFRTEHPIMGFRKSSIAPCRNRTRSENDVVLDIGAAVDVESKVMVRPRNRAQSEPDFIGVESSMPTSTSKRKPVDAVLDQILREADHEGRGITRVATTEITLLIWMMMDAGQAWTHMALHLLSKHEDACSQVQAEIDYLAGKYHDRLFTPFVLSKMEKLDNLIYEAIRFCPAFMGGVKRTNATVELDSVQVPKNSNVLLSNLVEEESFTISYDPPKQPQDMGQFYPSVDLYGFLPLQGLEIPIMVLQTKIFLIVTLQRHALVSTGKRQSFMRRMTLKIGESFRQIRSASIHKTPVLPPRSRSCSADDLCVMERGPEPKPLSVSAPSTPLRMNSIAFKSSPPTPQTCHAPCDQKHIEIRQEERIFTRVPFPEPRRPVGIVPRSERILFPASPDAAHAKPGMVSRCITR
jgi:hypothetical protein